MESIYQFFLLFDKTNNAQNDYILSLDIFKSYLFNKSIPILGNKMTKNEFIKTFLNISIKYEDSIIINTKKASFLNKKYSKTFAQYLYGNFIELLDKQFYESQKSKLTKSKNGLNPSKTRFFEIIRYYTIKYFNMTGKNIDNDDISFILKEPEFKLYEINVLVELMIRLWYKNVLNLMIENYYAYLNNNKLIYIIIFLCFIVLSILYYFIIWRIYQEKLNVILKGSFDLINLIPQEIKNIIIEKLNE